MFFKYERLDERLEFLGDVDMTASLITFNQVLIMIIIIAIGALCYKVKLIDNSTNQKLSNIVLMLVNPMVIFVSYQRDYDNELLEGLLLALLLSIITHIVSITISYLLIRKKRKIRIEEDGIVTKKYVDNKDVEVERMCTIYSNVGFMGIPLMNGIFGSVGVFYATASITIFNIFIWTHGVILMSGQGEFDLKGMLKKLISPTLIAIILGLLFFLLQIRIPGVLHEAFPHIHNMNTPLAMLVAGVTIGQADFKKLITNYRIYIIAFLKLLFIPILLLLVYRMFPIDETVLSTAVILAGAPTASTTIMFAMKYKKNSLYAAEIFTVTTLLSAITIPFIVMLLG